MFTAEEQNTLMQLRQQCQIKLETHIKEMDGGFLLTTTERFVNPEGTIIAQAVHTKICGKNIDVPNEIFNIYVGVPTTESHDDSKVEYLNPVPASVPEQERYTEDKDDPARIG